MPNPLEQLKTLELKANFNPQQREYFNKLRDELDAIVGGVSIEDLTKPSDAGQAGRIRAKLEEVWKFVQDREVDAESWYRDRFMDWVAEFQLERWLPDEWIDEHMEFSGNGIVCNGKLELYGTAITHLPDNLTVRGDLILQQSYKLVSLPGDLKVAGNLDLLASKSFAVLPDNLTVGGNLLLNGCGSLVHLPPGLNVSGDLNLTLCTSLKTIGPGSVVGGNLYCAGCDELNSLPNDFQVGGEEVVISAVSLRLWLKFMKLQKRGQIKGIIKRA